jgi:putative MATE family efflux protein
MKSKRNFKSIFVATFVELFFFTMMGTIDAIMLSNLNDHAVGSVGNANTLIQIFAVLLLIVTNGVAVLVSQYIGANRNEKARQVIGSGLLVNLLIGLALAIIMHFSVNFLLTLIQTDSSLMEDSKTYFQVIGYSFVFMAFSAVAAGALRSYGYAKYITIVAICGNVLNMFANYVFINGYLGFPRLGVFGAAISTFGVRGLMMITYLIILMILIKLKLSDLKMDRESNKNIFRIGLPSAAESFSYTAMQIIILGMINSLGPDFTTAKTYMNIILTYIIIFSLSFATANAVMTGYYIGERNYDKAHQETNKAVLRSFVTVLLVTLIVNLSSGLIINIFTQNQVIITTVRKVLWIALLLEFGRSINMITLQALRSAGDTTYPLVIAVMSMMGIAVPVAYLFGIYWGFGLFGIYIAHTLDELIRAGFAVFRWHSRKWEAKSSYLEKDVTIGLEKA